MVENRKSALRRRSDPLHRLPIGSVERGAKNLVPLDDPIQSSLQSGAVQLTGEIHPAMRSVGVSNSTQLIQEPEPLLRKRHDPLNGCTALSDIRRKTHITKLTRLHSRYGPVGIKS